MAESALIPYTSELPAVQKAGFKRLRMKHRRIAALHLGGCSNKEIAQTLGHEPSYVSTVLRDPLVAKILEEAYADFEMEIKALTPLAIEAIRRNVHCGDGPTELRAAELTFKINHRFDNGEDARQTAEDVIERVLEVVGANGGRLRYAERQFLRQPEEKKE